MNYSYNEFHVSRTIRDLCGFNGALFSSSGNVIFTSMTNVRQFAQKLNDLFEKRGQHSSRISAGNLNAMGLIDEIFHFVCMLYRRDTNHQVMAQALAELDRQYGRQAMNELLELFNTEFPPTDVYKNNLTVQQYLEQEATDAGTGGLRTNRESTLEEMMLLHLANENPAFRPFTILFDEARLQQNPLYEQAWKFLQDFFAARPHYGPYHHDLISLLREPMQFSPFSLKGQLDYIKVHWATFLAGMRHVNDLDSPWIKRLLAGMDVLSEEEKAAWHPTNGGSPDMSPYSYDHLSKEYERYSPDQQWMPRVILMAKTVLVWLDQLSKKYKRSITQLDQIPDEELDMLAQQGFTGLWLIGLWERSAASRRIKQLCGNPEAAASAYSLFDYNIASSLGGWSALENLRWRLWQRGIRLASDMVPNHTGLDSNWVMEKPDLFIQRRDCPFPQYTFTGENLSKDSRTSVYLEDHYYDKTDCAVVFKRVDNTTGDVRYIYHGNDGTGMPWNDTAQIDFLNPAAREAVMQEILHVARNFPIIRFDAAMVLAKKHIRRLWYPQPGHGGDIATRSETGLSEQQFEQAIPEEFWRQVVDRVAKEVPDTLLLAEAFWMMEGYFVRTLGMHRVYNSAFMNMLKKEENKKYRDTVKNTLVFDPQILKRFVNFMNNPDEETAVAQFGKGDKYFGVCTLMVTMPGLPMFGHGQIEGFEEKYGMEYTKAYKNETPDIGLVNRHWHDIFPLMKKRYIFADVTNFLFYDVWNEGVVQENIFAYSNSFGSEYAVVFYNNKYERSYGWIKQSVPYMVKTGSGEHDVQTCTRSISQGLGLTAEDDKYCIFQEQHSGLWYVRSSTEICRQGIFVSLNGFEYQVLMNIAQVQDGPDHKYRTLCDMLAGKGSEDLEIEWKEICYKDLYRPLAAFLTPQLIGDLCALYTEAAAGTIKKTKASAILKQLLEQASPYARTFYHTAGIFAQQKKDTSEKQFKTFAKLLRTQLKLIYQLKEQTKARRAKNFTAALQRAAKDKDTAAFMRVLFYEYPMLPELLICYAAVKTAADTGLALTWSLARKLAGYLREAGCKEPSQELTQRILRLLMLAAAPNKTLNAKNAKPASFAIVSYLTQGAAGAFLTGANQYDGVHWFNKERCDSSLALLYALRLLCAGKPQEERLLTQYQTIVRAQKKAAYRCDQFMDVFATKKKKTAAKAAAKKSARTGKASKAAKASKAGKASKTAKKKGRT